MLDKIVFSKFNSRNLRPQQIVNFATNVPTSILYGYSDRHIIAVVKNKIFDSTLESLATQYSSLWNYIDLNFNDIYSQLSVFQDAMLTLYSYKPLVGLTTIRDAKNNTTYYNYDKFNRLSTTLDSNHNILTENNYHLKSDN